MRLLLRSPLQTTSGAFRAVVAHLSVPVALLAGVPAMHALQRYRSTAELLENFKGTRVFWQQLEVAKKLAATGDASVLSQLEPWLSHDDRHLREMRPFSLQYWETVVVLR